PTERHLHPLADRDLVGVEVGELDREPAAAVEVDDREDDRRARRVHHAVDRERRDRAAGIGHRHGVHRVDPRPVGRDPLRGQVDRAGLAVAGADEAELPRLAPGRGARRHTLRLGTARRLEGHHPAPREELAVPDRRAGLYDATASVARNSITSAPSASTTSAMSWPGSAVSSADVRRRDGWAAPVLPTVAARSSTGFALVAPSLPVTPRTARACSPVTIRRSTWSAESSACFSAAFQARSPSGT